MINKKKNAKTPGQNDFSWHSHSVEEARGYLNVPPEGLQLEEIQRRQQLYGPNSLTLTRPPGALHRFLVQFHNALIYVLLFAAIMTAFMKHWVDTGVILGVVLINAIIGFIQEGKAASAMESIRKMLSLQATIRRDGRRFTVLSESLVPGDIVSLASGDRIPADIRLMEENNFSVDESALTGESAPVEKSAWTVDEDASLGDRTNMVYSGTLVTYGTAVGIVVATGDKTEFGRIGKLLNEMEDTYTPVMHDLFGTDNLTLKEWALVICVGITTFFLMELDKCFQRRLAEKRGAIAA